MRLSTTTVYYRVLSWRGLSPWYKLYDYPDHYSGGINLDPPSPRRVGLEVFECMAVKDPYICGVTNEIVSKHGPEGVRVVPSAIITGVAMATTAISALAAVAVLWGVFQLLVIFL